MINGVINIYKEAGYTSHDVVAKLRGILKQKKIGHTGTLDPQAVGVLPVCLGNATKLCDMLTDKDKTYETVVLLGKTTDTQDVFTENILTKCDVPEYELEEIERCVAHFQGESMQIPPMYSALKVNGQKLYELARKGEVIERKPRKIVIYEIEIIDVKLPHIKLRVSCSKGTYIRTLCHDIGERLGCGACMEELKRTKVERFEVKESVTLQEVETLVKSDKLEEILTPVDEMFSHLPQMQIGKELSVLLHNGGRFEEEQIADKAEALQDEALVRMYDSENRFIAIYKYEKKQECFKPLKMFGAHEK